MPFHHYRWVEGTWNGKFSSGFCLASAWTLQHLPGFSLLWPPVFSPPILSHLARKMLPLPTFLGLPVLQQASKHSQVSHSLLLWSFGSKNFLRRLKRKRCVLFVLPRQGTLACAPCAQGSCPSTKVKAPRDGRWIVVAAWVVNEA